MAHPSTLYRFRIDLTDIDRNVYERLDVRTPMHPSESETYLVTRILAYALNSQEGLQFSKEGLGAPDDPTLSVSDPGGGFQLWIEIGNPSTKKLHKATKSSPHVKIYTYKNPKLLIQEIHAARIFQPERIELYSFDDSLLSDLASTLTRDNSWNVIHQERGVMIQVGDESFQGEVISHSVVS